jgi:hypothetical protein
LSKVLLTAAAAVSGATHGVSMATLFPPAAGEASGGGLLGALAVAAQAALLVTAARIRLNG